MPGDPRMVEWTPAARLATISVAGVLAGGLLIYGLARANVCPKLRRAYRENWLRYGYGLAEWTRREAAERGCKWALEPRPPAR